ncbi:MAG: O-antigen ligase family protein [Bryobacteraceae bacterium]
MTGNARGREFVRWLVLAGCSISITAAALGTGGVHTSDFQWVSLAIAVLALLTFFVRSRRPGLSDFRDLALLGLLVVWILLQLTPLPPALVQLVSFRRWQDLDTVRTVVGASRESWMQTSVAPNVTFERLLNVLTGIAAYITAREMGRWWPGAKMWTVTIPVLLAGTVEGILGLLQFSPGVRVSGSYVNRNHYAGLLEMAYPLAIAWAFSIWSANAHRRHREPMSLRTAIGVSITLGSATIMFFGIAVSQSRMGFLAAVTASATMAILYVAALRRVDGPQGGKSWLAVVAIPLVLVLLFITGPLAARFALVPALGTADGRMQIARETLRVIMAYPWTGCGLGALEHALYRFRVSLPDVRVDYAHNDYLQVLAELGILGGLLFVALGIWLVRGIYISATDIRSKHFFVGIGLIGSLFAIGLHSLVDFNLYIPANGLALAWIAGIGASPTLRED